MNQIAARNASDPSFNETTKKTFGNVLDFQLDADVFYGGHSVEKELTWYWHYYYGNCYQFNFNLTATSQNNFRMANVPGPQFGFQLRILNLDEEVTYTSGLGYGFGMKVFVHNNSLQPRFFEEGVYVSAGQVSYICVRRTFVQNEPAPYTECIDLTSYSSELYDFITKTSNRVYRQKYCIDLCIQKYIIDNCFCFYVLYDNTFGNTTGYCSSNSDVTCAENHKKDFPNVVDCISNYCPLECESIQYDYSVSSNIWPSYTTYQADSDPDKLDSYDAYGQKMSTIISLTIL